MHYSYHLPYSLSEMNTMIGRVKYLFQEIVDKI